MSQFSGSTWKLSPQNLLSMHNSSQHSCILLFLHILRIFLRCFFNFLSFLLICLKPRKIVFKPFSFLIHKLIINTIKTAVLKRHELKTVFMTAKTSAFNHICLKYCLYNPHTDFFGAVPQTDFHAAVP